MIRTIFKEEVDQMLVDSKGKEGLYVTFQSGKWVGIDNLTNEMWVEEFNNLDEAIHWLRNPEYVNEIKKYKIKIANKLSIKRYKLSHAISLAEYIQELTGLDIELVEVF